MTGVGAVVNAARVAAGESVAVFGLGGVGLAALLGAHASGADPLIAVDLATHKFELARSLGATHCIDAADPDAIKSLRELSQGGVQFAIESVGNERVSLRRMRPHAAVEPPSRSACRRRIAC